jgi:ABC-type transporter MlaC component
VTNFESRTEFGTRFKNLAENPYAETLMQYRESWKQMMQKGQPASDVATLLQEVIESPNPPVWVQTSQEVTNKVAEHFKDPSGKIRVPKSEQPFPVAKL